MNNVLASVSYERSPSGEPTRITREDGSYVVLTYDAALRVDTETYYDADDDLLDAIDYGYDLDGNRTSKNSLAGGNESYGYEPGFKLTSITTHAGTETYGYDGGGRNTSIVRGGVSRTLQYNSDDKLTRVLDGGSEVIAYAYDGVGRRVGKTQGGATVRYLVAPNLGDGFETPQAVTDGSGEMLAQFVFAGEQPIARITAGGQVSTTCRTPWAASSAWPARAAQARRRSSTTTVSVQAPEKLDHSDQLKVRDRRRKLDVIYVRGWTPSAASPS